MTAIELLESSNQLRCDESFNKLKKDIAENHPLMQEYKFELNSQLFDLSEGQVRPSWSNFNPVTGETTNGSPDYEKDLGKNGIDYLKSRAQKTNNLYLKLRYNQIIYRSPNENNNQYAIEAVNASKKIIEGHISNNEITKETEILLKNLIGLSESIKTIHKEITEFCIEVVLGENFNSRTSLRLVLFFCTRKKLFKQSDIKKLFDLSKKSYENVKENEKNEYNHISACEILLNIAERIQSDTKHWYFEIGKIYESLLNNSLDKDDLRRISLCDEAIRNYEAGGWNSESKRLFRIREKIRDTFKLPSIAIDLEISKEEILAEVNRINLWVDNIVELSTEDFYRALSTFKGLFPTKDELLRELNVEPTFLQDFFGKIIFDSNSNIVTTSNGGKDDKLQKETLKIHQSYSFKLNFTIVKVLDQIVFRGVVNGKFDSKNLLTFINQKTWIGKYPISGSYNQNSATWGSVLAPAIHNYFLQINANLVIDSFVPNYELSLDSLTTKFEGVFRDMAKIMGCVVSKTTTDGTREMFLHELLREKEIVDKFDADDILFFIHLYLNNGLNLRNKICHSLYTNDTYSYMNTTLVLMSILRLCKYDITIKN